MSHRVHPKSYRIKGIEDWSIRGFYGSKIARSFEADFNIKEFLSEKLADCQVASIEIEHSMNKMNIIINSARPGLIIGRGGEGVEQLKAEVQKMIAKSKTDKKKKEIKIEIREIKNPWISASLVSQVIAQQIEKRVPFRQVLKRSIERVMQNREVKGVRIAVAGRLNGIEIARREWMAQGRMPRQTIRADIDYFENRAYCTYGVIGVKVWIYKGEKFD